MKVKDLKSQNLVGIKVKIPKEFRDSYIGISEEMYIFSWWSHGVWFKKQMKEERIYPLSIDPKEILNFTLAKNEKQKITI